MSEQPKAAWIETPSACHLVGEVAQPTDRRLLRQLERYRVERYKRVRALGKWQWVTVGFFNAASTEEARKLGREAIADKICILRAIAVGRETP